MNLAAVENFSNVYNIECIQDENSFNGWFKLKIK